jgi:preprotein translocase subunit SecB
MAHALRLSDFRLLACQFEILGDVADRAAEANPPGESARPVAETQDTDASEDFVSAAVEAADATEPASSANPDRRHEVPGVELDYSTTEEDDEFVFILRLKVTDPTVPYSLEVVTGSRFEIPDPPVVAQQAEPTLLFVSYPYVRELVASITGRSPYQAFALPPLTRLPHPTVTGEKEQESVEELQDPATE